MKVALTTNFNNLLIEFIESVKAFYPFCVFVNENADFYLHVALSVNDKHVTCELFKDNQIVDLVNSAIMVDDEVVRQREIKKVAKIMIYKYLSKLLGVSLPYGSLTGVRPTKLYKQLSESGKAYDILREEYLVGEQKLNLIKNIVDFQNQFKAKAQDIDLYINIPFCETRCSYCSFISIEKAKLEKYYKTYLKVLKEDILQSLNLILKNSRKIRSIYIGGGTPTILSEEEILDVFSVIKKFKPLEYTFESGRPDSITKEKLFAIKEVGANRISINPQTFKQETLNLINRKHSIEDIYRSFENAKQFNFKINMDLIAMLPNENLDDFKNSLDECLKLSPNDITVHSLTLKKGSQLTQENYENSYYELAQQVNLYSQETLIKAGYRPYYLYRLKKSSGGLENLGYTRDKVPCFYNIDSMEEEADIMTCGAGGISKIINSHSIKRFSVNKDVVGYINNFEEMFQKKSEFFKNH